MVKNKAKDTTSRGFERVEEYVEVPGCKRAGKKKQVKTDLGFEDFMGLGRTALQEDAQELENVDGVNEFALLYREDYNGLKGQMDVNTALQGFLTEGEFSHISYDEKNGYISGALDLLVIPPLVEAVYGYNVVTGDKLSAGGAVLERCRCSG